VWTENDGLIYVNAVLDCADRECMGRNVSRRNDANEAAWAPKMRFSGVWAHCQPARLWDRPRYAASDFCGDWIAS